jgi:hypothetical protein
LITVLAGYGAVVLTFGATLFCPSDSITRILCARVLAARIVFAAFRPQA